MAVSHAPVRDRAALVGLRFGTRRGDAAERSLRELAGLASAPGADVALRSLQERPKLAPACFLGRGKVRQIAAACEGLDVDPVAVDAELSPDQAGSLERELGRRVIDRTRIILDMLASRARTREGRLPAVYRLGRVPRHEREGETVSMEVEGPVDVVERWRRDGRGRESPCA